MFQMNPDEDLSAALAALQPRGPDGQPAPAVELDGAKVPLAPLRDGGAALGDEQLNAWFGMLQVWADRAGRRALFFRTGFARSLLGRRAPPPRPEAVLREHCKDSRGRPVDPRQVDAVFAALPLGGEWALVEGRFAGAGGVGAGRESFLLSVLSCRAALHAQAEAELKLMARRFFLHVFRDKDARGRRRVPVLTSRPFAGVEQAAPADAAVFVCVAALCLAQGMSRTETRAAFAGGAPAAHIARFRRPMLANLLAFARDFDAGRYAGHGVFRCGLLARGAASLPAAGACS